MSRVRAEDLARWMRQRVAAANARGLLVGLSGGLGSAVMVRLAHLATPGRVAAVLLAPHVTVEDEQQACALADWAGRSIAIERIDISATVNTLTAALPARQAAGTGAARADTPGISPDLLTERLRLTALMSLANGLQYFVAGTLDRTDLAIGRFARHGEHDVDMLPLGRLMRSDVRALALDLDVPSSIVDRVTNAGRPAGAGAEDPGVTAIELDRYFAEGPQAVAPALALRIERLLRATEHNPRLPPMPD